MAATDSKPIPIKNQAYRLYFDGRKNDGTLITTGTGMDTELSKDAGTFADATNEAVEIATSSGVYYLELTAAEMNFDNVVVKVTWTNTGAIPAVIVLYPQEAGDILVTPEALSAQAKADINAEVVDVLNVDTFAELTSVPSSTPTLTQALRWLYTLGRNKITQTATTQLLRNNADAGTIGTSTVSDDGTTFIRGKFS